MRLHISKKVWHLISLLLVILIANSCVNAQHQDDKKKIVVSDQQLQAIDSIINASYPSNEPGAAVLLAQNGKVLLRKGYGMANMELQIPVNPDHVFGIGTMSLYYTAVAILMLQEQGMLNIKDDIRKYLPNYNTHGKTITIENLLNHTCGIPGYREYISYGVKAKLEESRYAGLQFAEEQPLLFDPGTDWSYSLSGYGLLSIIVEKASKQSFNEFLKTQIFNKLDLSHTYAGSKAVIPQKTTGYLFNPAKKIYERFEEGPYVQYSVGIGSIMSTVDDLFKWHRALNDGKLIRPETLKTAWTSQVLPNGLNIHYGYGRTINKVSGYQFVGHGGVMPNYLSDEWLLPDQDIYFVILSNQRKNARTPPLIANRVASILTGYNAVMQIKPSPTNSLKKLEGVFETTSAGTRLQKNYSARKTVQWKLYVQDSKLFSQREGINKIELIQIDDSTWYTAGDPFNRYIFRQDDRGNISGFTIVGVYTQTGPSRFAIKTQSNIPPPPPSIVLQDLTKLNMYTGVFQWAEGTRQKFIVENNKLVVTDEDNADKKELFFIGSHTFFDPKTEIKYKFLLDKLGKVIEVNYYNGTNDIVAKRIRDNY